MQNFPTAKRNAEIFHAWRNQGKTLAELARTHLISTTRIAQILKAQQKAHDRAKRTAELYRMHKARD